MDGSILNSIKKLIGLQVSDTSFDTDLIIHINTVFGILNQLGCGPETNFKIVDSTAKWSDFIGEETDLDIVMSYMYMRVRKMFDPPTTGSIATAIDETIKELEWRISVIVDSRKAIE